MNSGPLSTRMLWGWPRMATSKFRAATTRRPVSEVSTSIAKHSRVKRSITPRQRKRRPSPSWSWTKSIAQASLGRAGASGSSRGTEARRLRCRRRTSQPFSRKSRSTSL